MALDTERVLEEKYVSCALWVEHRLLCAHQEKDRESQALEVVDMLALLQAQRGRAI